MSSITKPLGYVARPRDTIDISKGKRVPTLGTPVHCGSVSIIGCTRNTTYSNATTNISFTASAQGLASLRYLLIIQSEVQGLRWVELEDEVFAEYGEMWRHGEEEE